MNARMEYLLDQLAHCEREEQQSGDMEMLPPMHAENERPGDLETSFVLVFSAPRLPAAAEAA